ncbi:cytochrome C oxidase assembly protein [Methyloceanibacter superfactus]|jgi:cytochrome c oxidase assembly protein subunit 11|uniref:Cytochrome c oxidase assembly protein CtaG n=1 Tax=Methyloceanibacter superfactus TaxID=1774969 RepID=A0A1E3VWC9_9HYPH|nr:cytochrome c oxidase assembly protein [Methyloceanibacter superfactus]ODR97822.1 cytochrome C oxidase assembly protein [Methyloceanibacter superfactus]
MSDKTTQTERRDRKGIIALALSGLVAGMVGLSFAAVPLYQMFCQTTGYGGATQKAEAAPGEVLDRTITIRFDANVDRDLPWTFAPVQRVMDVKIGESSLAFFRAHNNTDKPVTGTAGFNVAPESAGRYFTKIECFCFTKQTLAAGQSVEMPVTFFVDPKIVDDDTTKNISEITLSYTFYRNDDQPDVAAAPAGQNSGS